MTVRPAGLAEILALRHAVLCPGRPLATARFDGDEEVTTVHLGAFEGATLVGCATVMRRPFADEGAAQLRGMATAPERVGEGIGSLVVRYAETIVGRDWRLGLAWCNARTTARGFYERVGWSVVSQVFDIPDVGPHVRMIRRLPPAT